MDKNQLFDQIEQAQQDVGDAIQRYTNMCNLLAGRITGLYEHGATQAEIDAARVALRTVEQERDSVLAAKQKKVSELSSQFGAEIFYTGVVPPEVMMEIYERAAAPKSKQETRGRRGYGTKAEKGQAYLDYLDWRAMPNEKRPGLDEWLDETFGSTGGKLNVPSRTIQDWGEYAKYVKNSR